MKFTVVGLFENEKNAQEARQKLLSTGIGSERIDVSLNRTEGSTVIDNDYDFEEDEDTGGFWNWLFGDDDETRTKYSKVSSRNTVMTVYADTRSDAERVAEKLDDLGALDVDEQYAKVSHANEINEGDKTIPIVKEEVAVGKREVEKGGVRVRTKVVEKPVNESIRLRKERVYVNRKPVDRVVDANDAFNEETITMTERVEEAVVEKTARVVEEVTVGKEVKDTTEAIAETVRETKVDVDNNIGSSLQNTANTVGHGRRVDSNGAIGFNEGRVDRIFDNVKDANNYYDFLMENGYSSDDITILMSEDTKNRFYADNDHISKTSEEALKGAGTGSAIGGTAGAILGAVAAVGGAVLVPGLGLAVAGPIAATLAGAGVGGASGALIGALTKAGLSESVATEYRDAMDDGQIIISFDPKENDSFFNNYSYGREVYNGPRTVI